ncbi:MAG: hypothetical protein AAGH89_14675 [Verrucomicrobiota bacterium]
MNSYNWESTFMELFNRCLKRYQRGDSDFTGYYTDDDASFLKSIGYKPREFFDFVEDYADGNDPSPTTAVLVAAARRDYLQTIMDGNLSDHEIKPGDLPGKGEELGGIRWLPRIIKKAEGKLRGELDPDIMYCCGGDRAFLSRHDIHPADFLRVVWAADGNAEYVIDYVKNS